MNRIKARKISKCTYFSKEQGISIFAPDDDGAAKIIEKLVQLLQGKSEIHVFSNPDPSALYTAKNPVILIGNLSNSRCVEAMYYKYLLVTDLTYPGISGFELRTLDWLFRYYGA